LRVREAFELLPQLTGLLRLLTGHMPDVTGLLPCPELPVACVCCGCGVWGLEGSVYDLGNAQLLS